MLATKALSSLLSGDFVGAWKSGVTWACLAVVGGTSLGQIRWLNRALMRFQSKVCFLFAQLLRSSRGSDMADWMLVGGEATWLIDAGRRLYQHSLFFSRWQQSSAQRCFSKSSEI